MKSKLILAFLTSFVVLLSSVSLISAGSVISDKCDDYRSYDEASKTWHETDNSRACRTCLDTSKGGSDINTWTSIGCLKAGSPKDLISQLLGWGVVLGGGIAFILIVVAGFQITTAGGDAKRVKAAQELLTSAISGLLLIVFSILLLNFIGIQILDLGTWFKL